MTAPNRVITFYSYKGGAGRTMALANIAWILASNGRRVLAIDWDLEAPGLHRFFEKGLLDAEQASSDGLIDFLLEYVVEATTAPDKDISSTAKGHWHDAYANLGRFAQPINTGFARGCLEMIGAGRQNADYGRRVNLFDWRSFYERLGGGAFLDAAFRKLRDEYDYILIDSRTGVSDTSGICTMQLPDTLVAMFTMNKQSLEGAAAVAADARRQRDGKLTVYPVPARIDMGELERFQKARARAQARFALLVALLTPEEQELLNELEISEVPYYLYEEALAAVVEAEDKAHLLRIYERLTDLVSNGDVKRLAEPAGADAVRARFRSLGAAGDNAPAAAARSPRRTAAGPAHVFLSHHNADNAHAIRVARGLRARGVRAWLDVFELRPSDWWGDAAAEALGAADVVLTCIGEHGLSPWQHRELAAAAAQHVDIGWVCLPGWRTEPGLSGFNAQRAFRLDDDWDRGLDLVMEELRARGEPSVGGRAGLPVGAGPFDGSPYPGIDHAFGPEHAAWFFGREAMTARVVEAVQKERWIWLVGSSGSGKSSLAHAGVMAWWPRANPTLGIATAFVPTERATDELAGALDRACRMAGKEPADVAGLGKRPEGWNTALRACFDAAPAEERPPLLVVIDQAEGMFGDGGLRGTCGAMLSTLWSLVRDDSLPVRVHVLMVLRADYLTRVLDQKMLAPTNVSKPILLAGMSPVDVRDAIELPAHLGGGSVEPAAVQTLVDAALAHEHGLPLLQFVLREAWGRLPATDRILRAAPIGQRPFEDAIGRLIRQHQPLVDDQHLDALVPLLIEIDEQDMYHRRWLRPVELKGRPDREALERILGVLVEARVAVAHADGETIGSDPRWQLAHDAVLSAWQPLARAIGRRHDRLKQIAALGRLAREGALLRGSLLRRYDGLRDEPSLPPDVKAFLGRSRQTARRRLAYVAIGVAVLLLTFIAAVYQYSADRALRREAALRDGDRGRFTLELQPFDWSPEEGRLEDPGYRPAQPIPTDAADLPQLVWTLHKPDRDDPDRPGEELARGRRPGRWTVRDKMLIEEVEARGGNAVLVVNGRGRAPADCGSSIVPLRALPGYAQRDRKITIRVSVPSCQTTFFDAVEIPRGPFVNDDPTGTPTLEDSLPTFWMDRTEISNAEFQVFADLAAVTGFAFATYPPELNVAGGPEMPRTDINARDADVYCRFLGKGLPTSEQWVKAMRGGLTLPDGKRNDEPTRRYPWGDALEASRANIAPETGTGMVAAVGTHPGDVSPYGVLDLAGNVQEWTLTTVGLAGALRMTRGGNWFQTKPEQLAAFMRDNTRSPRQLNYYLGARCALSGAFVPPPATAAAAAAGATTDAGTDPAAGEASDRDR